MLLRLYLELFVKSVDLSLEISALGVQLFHALGCSSSGLVHGRLNMVDLVHILLYHALLSRDLLVQLIDWKVSARAAHGTQALDLLPDLREVVLAVELLVGFALRLDGLYHIRHDHVEV